MPRPPNAPVRPILPLVSAQQLPCGPHVGIVRVVDTVANQPAARGQASVGQQQVGDRVAQGV